MNNAAILAKGTLKNEIIGSLDHAEPAEQMKAIGAVMEQYFESVDWLKKRNKLFSGQENRSLTRRQLEPTPRSELPTL